MADYGFKKLSEVEVVENPNESTNVLIEENGIIKKVSVNALFEAKLEVIENGTY